MFIGAVCHAMPQVKDVYVCKSCGKQVPVEARVPQQCPFCGGVIVKKVVVE